MKLRSDGNLKAHFAQFKIGFHVGHQDVQWCQLGPLRSILEPVTVTWQIPVFHTGNALSGWSDRCLDTLEFQMGMAHKQNRENR